MALKQWYETMIPALFPMMLLSSVLVDTGFAAKIGMVLNKSLLRFLKISNHGCYCLLTGFLCGFPMGAKTTADMYQNQRISLEEANYLLCFINCIGPMYTINLTHVLFPEYELWKLLTGLYALPLIYGLILRYFCPLTKSPAKTETNYFSLSDAILKSVPNCGRSILMLGGYMILFQSFFIPLKELLYSISVTTTWLHPLLEITGGLFLQTKSTPLALILFWNTWGGLCCMLQTDSLIKPAGLSMKSYVFHKTILALLAYLLGILLHQI